MCRGLTRTLYAILSRVTAVAITHLWCERDESRGSDSRGGRGSQRLQAVQHIMV